MDNIGRYEGSVAPAFIDRALAGRASDMIRKLPLRLGRVVKAYAPKDQQNRNQKYYEYDVVIDEGSEHRPSTRFTVNNCMVMSQFGGVADYSFWTPRALQSGKNDQNDTSEASIGYGSQVLVLLVNGSSFGGVILGGVQHSNGRLGDGTGDDNAADDIIFGWRFNGVTQTVDVDGQYHIVYTGKSKEDGTSDVDSAITGTSLHFLKDGGFKVHTKDEEQFLFIDHASHIVNVKAKNKFNLSSEGDQTFTASAGLIKTDSLGVHLGGATDAMVVGTTYRVQETAMHTAMQTALATLSAGTGVLAGAGAALTAAAADPVLLGLAPVAAASIGTAGAAVSGAAAAMTTAVVQLTTAISAFEAASATYLSTKNRLDF